MMASQTQVSRDVVLKTLEPIRDRGGRSLHVRVLDVRGTPRLDVREFIDADSFQGYTRKGICVTREEFEALLEQANTSRVALDR
jgi:Transcriptional Coactivator p15 (PC4)